MLVGEVINNQVVDGVAIGEAELRVERLADGESRDVIGNEILQERERTSSFDLEFAHVADIEEAGASAYRFVLFQNTAVLNRHLPAAKLYKPRAHRAMLFVERSTFQRGCRAVLCCHKSLQCDVDRGTNKTSMNEITVSLYQILGERTNGQRSQ